MPAACHAPVRLVVNATIHELVSVHFAISSTSGSQPVTHIIKKNTCFVLYQVTGEKVRMIVLFPPYVLEEIIPTIEFSCNYCVGVKRLG